MTFLGGTGYLGEILDVTTGNGLASGMYAVRFDGNNFSFANTEGLPELENRVLNLEKEQLVLPTHTDISVFSQSIMSRFNSLDTSNTDQQETIDKLVQGFASIKKTLNDLEGLFVSHTGISGAHDF